MLAGISYLENKKVTFAFSPVIEMLSAIHVVSAPQHHLDRMDWMNSIAEDNKLDPHLMHAIVDCADQTCGWTVIMSILHPECWSLTVSEAIERLDRAPIGELNRLMKEYGRPPVRTKYKDSLCRIMKEFYDSFFRKELPFTEAYITRLMKKEQAACEGLGLYPYLRSIHERIRVTESDLVFIKNKHYSFSLDEIQEITVLGNSFISPHLLVEWSVGKIGVCRLFTVERGKSSAPEDLVRLFKGLGDETRLRLLKAIGQGERCTQELAPMLGVSEACVSKHLKLLHTSGILRKCRKGSFVYYAIDPEKIDFIPYSLYEYVMRSR